jgi:hypothetical protein
MLEQLERSFRIFRRQRAEPTSLWIDAKLRENLCSDARKPTKAHRLCALDAFGRQPLADAIEVRLRKCKRRLG